MSIVPTNPGHPAATNGKPVLMAKGTTAEIGLHDLLSVLSMIIDHGQAGDLIAQSKAAQTNVVVPAATANLVKTMVAAHPKMSAHPVGMKVIGDPADGTCCNFKP